MSPQIVVLIVGFIIQRAEKGFPILSELFNRRKKELEAAAVAAVAPADKAPIVGAAPDAVKQFVIAQLTKVRDASSGWTRILLTFVLNIAPTLADEIWDKIAELLAGKDGTIPPMMGASAAPFAAVAFADACDAVNID